MFCSLVIDKTCYYSIMFSNEMGNSGYPTCILKSHSFPRLQEVPHKCKSQLLLSLWRPFRFNLDPSYTSLLSERKHKLSQLGLLLSIVCCSYHNDTKPASWLHKCYSLEHFVKLEGTLISGERQLKASCSVYTIIFQWTLGS